MIDMRLAALILSVGFASGEYYEVKQEKVVFPELSCAEYHDNAISSRGGDACGCDSSTSGASVFIEAGYVRGEDTLRCTNQSFVCSFNEVSGVLYITSTTLTTVSDFTNAIKSVAFHTTDTSGESKSLTYNYGKGIYSSRTGHFFNYFETPKTHAAAEADCRSDANKLLGSTGHLLMPSSEEAQKAAANTIPVGSDSWIGAELSGTEWSWALLGHSFYSTVTGKNATEYSNFAPGQPSAGDTAIMQQSGTWSTVSSATTHNYVCQWGTIDDICLEDKDASSTVTLLAGCNFYTSSAACESHASGLCEWDITQTSSSPCIPVPCQQHGTEISCDHDVRCHWGADPLSGSETCSTNYCSLKHSSVGPCTLDPKCIWVKNKVLPDGLLADLCIELHCPLVTERCECAKYETCVWDAGSGSCASKVNQGCPLADIVFIMDASGSMDSKFGAHPVGYYGMIEQIRDWLKDATLTGEPSSSQKTASATSGFRLGFISFGRADVALYPPSATLPGIGCTGECITGPGGLGANDWFKPNFNTEWPSDKRWKKSIIQATFPISGTTGDTPGYLSGKYSELTNDLDWHEAYFFRKWSKSKTYLLDGLYEGIQWLKNYGSNANGRRQIIMILTDGALHDKKADLQALNPTDNREVFGIVLRKGKGSTSASDKAAGTLKPIVTNPATHFVNVPLSNLKSDVLDHFCNPDSVFGKVMSNIAGGQQHGASCSSLTNDVNCMANAVCDWNYASSSCEISKCLDMCNFDLCVGNGCDYNSATKACTRKPLENCEQLQSAGLCDTKSGPGQGCCTWNAGKCTTDVCCNQKDSQSCMAYNVNSPQCTLSTPPVDGECAVTMCTYIDSSQTCTAKECSPLFTQSDCTSNSNCVWETSSGFPICKKLPCVGATSFADCIVDPSCEWDFFTTPSCKQRYCGKYTAEDKCNNDPICEYYTTSSPASCQRTECGIYESGTECGVNPKCYWIPNPTSPQKPYCKVHNCKDYDSITPATTASCQCNADPKCKWHADHCSDADFDQCPDLDVLFLLDGSGSMQQNFGIHPHGYLALMEMLKNWMTVIPLAKTPTSSTGGFRIAFIQFSRPGPTGIRQADCAGCTQGQFSGDEQTLINDIHYHEANYIKSTTVLLPALEAAKLVFVNTPPNRKKVMVIICDGKLRDPDLSPLTAATGSLIASQVTIVGVVIRRFVQSNPVDQEAARNLEPLVSSPWKDHLLNVPLEDIPEKVLKHFCDSNSLLGKAVASPVDVSHFHCSAWGYPDECNSDSQCEWLQPALSDGDCTSTSACPTLNCQSIPSQFAALWSCDNCRPQRGEIECGFLSAPSYTRIGTCGKPTCNVLCSSGECVADAKCSWDASTSTCLRKVCQHSTPTECVNDKNSICSWNTNTASCELKKCGAVFVKDKCEAKSPDCMWDTGVNPPICKDVIDCTKLDKTGCNTEADQCVWETCKDKGTINCSELGPPTTQDRNICNTVKGCNLEFVAASETFSCLDVSTPCLDTCREKNCQWPTIEQCLLDQNCKWDNSLGSCIDDKCRPYGLSTICNADPLCQWDPSGDWCIEKVCEPITIGSQCSIKPSCKWDGTNCVTTYCGKYIAEANCGNDPRCLWSDSGYCIYTPCEGSHPTTPAGGSGGVANPACPSDKNCKAATDSLSKPYCASNKCEDLTDRCSCLDNSDCAWKDGLCQQNSFLSCPDLDVVFILDGSGSMQAKFGHHPHGYYGMIEMLRTWIQTLPLTGESAGTPSVKTGGTFRLAFVQFSGKNRVEPFAKFASCTGCPNGRFSGVASELDAELVWHHENYFKLGTMIEKSLKMATGVFANSPTFRSNVLIVITDGEIFDPDKIAPQRQHLDAEDVQTFGVVVRKGQQHTPTDLKAQQTLLPIVSEPKDMHFLNVPLDDIPDALLNDFCDPNSLFGASIQKKFGTQPGVEVPCKKWSSAECVTDSSCAWKPFTDPTSPCGDPDACANLNCEKRPDALVKKYSCDQCKFIGGLIDCDISYNEKTWNGYCDRNECICHDNENTCTNASPEKCEWKGNTCVAVLCNVDNQQKCEDHPYIHACQWNAGVGCEIKQCPYITESKCSKDLTCFWDVTQVVPVCMPILVCSRHDNETKCQNDPAGNCEWDTFCPPSKIGSPECLAKPKCVDKMCHFIDAASCNINPSCEWKTAAATPANKDTSVPCVPKICSPYDLQSDCISNNLCEWDTVRGVCIENECSTVVTELDCTKNPHCLWDQTTPSGNCNKKYCWGHYGTDEQKCNNDKLCIFGKNGECIDKTCASINSAAVLDPSCNCKKTDGCLWDTDKDKCVTGTYSGCPPLDLTIVFDGSGSMSNVFGKHPTGYEGLITVMRDWIHTLPLTGEPASTGYGSSQDGFRVAFIQFSGEQNPGVARTDPLTNGTLTGDLNEIDSALDWHSQNPIYTLTYIREALDTAVQTFKSSPPNRMDILLVFTDGRLNDPLVLESAKQELMNENVKTFGIVVRRFTDKAALDIAAEATMKKIVSDPVDSHFLNLELDSIAGSALNTFCDSNGAFGSLITAAIAEQGPKSCSVLSNSQCGKSPFCDFNLFQQKCSKAACQSYCSESSCALDPGCTWASVGALQPTCINNICQAIQDSASCTSSNLQCTWQTNTAPSCIPIVDVDKTCKGQKTEINCNLNPMCDWMPGYKPGEESNLFSTINDGSAIASCGDIKGAIINIEQNYVKGKDALFCLACSSLQISSDFHSKSGILYLSSSIPLPATTFSEAIKSVVFATSDKSGKPRMITYNYGHAFYSSQTGHYYQYFPHPVGQDSITWDAAQAECQSDSNKMMGLTGYLVTITSEVEQKMAASKLEGQGWMGASDVGEEQTWKWVTGPEGCPPSPSCQFTANPSNPGKDSQQGSGTQITGGTLFYKKSTGNEPGAFSSWKINEPNDYRKSCSGSCADGGEDFGHFLNGGNWNDYPIDHTHIDGYICEWGGIGQLCASQDDLTGTITALPGGNTCSEKVIITKPNTSPSPTGVPTVPVTDVPVARTSTPAIPPVIDTPAPALCPTLSQNNCISMPGCDWVAGNCVTSGSCTDITSVSDCNELPNCYYHPIDKCVPSVSKCSDLNMEYVCLSYPMCELTSQDPCAVTTPLKCQWDEATLKCTDKKCSAPTQGDCIKDTNCIWATDGILLQCVEKPCNYDSVLLCNANSPQCLWQGNTCIPSPCARHSNEGSCGKDVMCLWDPIKQCVPTPCSVYGTDTAACLSHPNMLCAPNTPTSNQCVIRECSYYDTVPDSQCQCKTDSRCSWDSSSSVCKNAAFAGCPDLDLVILLDGSGSMKQPFYNKHPVGFFALLEMLRTWLHTLPLTGEDSTVGITSSVKNKGFRVSLVQFSPATPVNIDPTTNGRLTGKLSELDSALSWHEDNPLFKGTEISLGIKKSIEAFSDSPRHRKKVLLIFSDGRIKDASVLSPARATLQGMDIRTFGIVVRKQQLHTINDLRAAESLKHIVSEPTDTHQLNLVMDEIGSGVLSSFCDPTGIFGKLIVDPNPSSCPTLDEVACNSQSTTCSFNSFDLKCIDHACTAHCSQIRCESDPQNTCQWSATTDQCTNKPTDPSRPPPPSQRCDDFTRPLCIDNGACTWVAGYQPTSAISPFSGLSCDQVSSVQCTLPLSNSFVSIDNGFMSQNDTLSCPDCAAQNIISSYNVNTGVLSLSGTGTLSSYITALSTVTFMTTDVSGSARRVIYNFGSALYSSVTDSYFVSHPEWSVDTAKVECPKTSMLGLSGVLTSFATPDEIAYSKTKNLTAATCEFGKSGGGVLSINSMEVKRAVDIKSGLGNCQVTTGCQRYDSSSLCVSDNRCKWVDPSKCIDKTTCSSIKTATPCAAEYSCEWKGTTCVDKTGCGVYYTSQTCEANKCEWDFTNAMCKNQTGCKTLSALGSEDCNANSSCSWTPYYLPGNPTSLFSNIADFNGDVSCMPQPSATISITNGLTVGDILSCPACTILGLASSYNPASGVLSLSGGSSASDMKQAITSVIFIPISLTPERVVSYAYGDAVYLPANDHYFKVVDSPGVTWAAANQACKGMTHLGLGGYLASIKSSEIQLAVETLITKPVWLSGSKPADGSWMWNIGSSTVPVSGFSNWVPVMNTSGVSYSVMQYPSGRWMSSGSDVTVDQFVCEFGDIGSSCSDLKTSVGSKSMRSGITSSSGVCEPATQTGCGFYGSQPTCEANSTCQWNPDTATCVVTNTNCCVDSTHGSCSPDGCCVCDAGYSNCNTPGEMAICHLHMLDSGKCSACNSSITCRYVYFNLYC